ncbi:MAG: thiamine pyrophosphate-binding protein [Actinomycetota bacterium]|nr:thiamine pyrophosphate-binding protein [Actinomycetota bacterium]
MSAAPATPRLVRDATFERCLELGMDTIFSNPGSTEVPALSGLPSEFHFVLGLHEGAVVGMATGLALATELPVLVMLHTTAGLGNAVSALATARVNKAPLVVLVGQQDRRHLAARPFLAGQLEGLAGSYPVSFSQPARPQDLPTLVTQAWHRARAARGPAIVVVPMDDWLAEADELPEASPRRMAFSRQADPADLAEVAARLDAAANPALVVGADADSADAWSALTALAERLRSPVYQEAFGARAGFPQDHPLFAGHLPSARSALRTLLEPHDVILCVGAPAFRQYPYDQGPFVAPETWVGMIADSEEDAEASTSDLAIVAPIALACGHLTRLVSKREVMPAQVERRAIPTFSNPERGMYPEDVFAALAERLGPETVIIEESPSSRSRLQAMLPARRPLGFLSAAMGGLGFALPAAIGVKMGLPDRPVVAVVGDGSSIYSIQALWSAARYQVGVLLVVLCNRSYSIMDRLHERAADGPPPWPGFEEVEIAELASALGCPSKKVSSVAELKSVLDSLPENLSEMASPLVIAVETACEPLLVV